MAASAAHILVAQTAAKHPGNGTDKSAAATSKGGAFDAIFATLMAEHAAKAGAGAGNNAADVLAAVQANSAQVNAAEPSAAAKQLLQVLNGSASAAALTSANATPQDKATKAKPDESAHTAKADSESKDKGKAQIVVPPAAIAKAADNAAAKAPVSQTVANDTAQNAQAEDHKNGKTAKADKAEKTHKTKQDQPAATLLAALGVPTAQHQATAPDQPTKDAHDVAVDAAAKPKAKPAADAPKNAPAQAGVNTAEPPQGHGKHTVTGEAKPASQPPAAAQTKPDAAVPEQTVADSGQAKSDPASAAKAAPVQAGNPTKPAADAKPSKTALQDVLAALGAKSSPASKPAAGQTAATDTAKPASAKAQHASHDVSKPAAPATNKAALAATAAKPAHGNSTAAHSTTPAAPGQAIAAANDGKGAASDHSGKHDGHPAHHAAEAAAANAKPAVAANTAPQAQFQLPQHAAANNLATDPTAAAQTITNTAPTSVSAQLHVAPQAAAHTQQAVPLDNLGALAVNIAAHSKDGAQHFSIALHPADLGHIHVQLSVDHSGAAQAHLSADNHQTLQLLQQNGHHLERALKDTGLNLAGGGLNFSLKGQQQQNTGGQSGQGRSRNLSVSAVASAGSTADITAANANYSLAPGSVRLDIKV